MWSFDDHKMAKLFDVSGKTVEFLSENGDILTALSVPAAVLETVKTYG